MKPVSAAKTSLIIVVAFTVLVGCSGAPQPETDPEVGTVVEYEVFGMDCPGCHGGLENLVLDIDGVRTAKASWEEKKLTMTMADGAEVSDEEIRAAIDRANFTAGKRLK